MAVLLSGLATALNRRPLTDADGSLRIRLCRWELEEKHGKLV
jgi:hypothetical protein